MNLLAATAATWGLPLSPTQLDQFTVYAAELRRWNERINLTAVADEPGIVTRHFLDSLRCAQSWGVAPESLIDIGAGAGFPGLPLKILRPELQLTLVESIAKKAAFLRHIAETLGLTNVEIVVARAEVAGRNPAHREHYAVATARAVAELRILAEYCLPLCRIGGRFLAPKGAQIEHEVQAALPAIELLGGQLAAIEPVELPDLEPRTLVIVDKISPTPPQYPRAPGVPAKRPL
ncbi:MAG TPA: 16S rRNA (guanine(527)-N(7))-methyltransferase RsmG [Roseiflexaceae bacterium]|nr:16S rRNA (guanine(527)-N(7))-methyltransferase RsmG [Roseiflexaceae bacterium]